MRRALPLPLLAAGCSALMYDVVQKHQVPPDGGCKDWADVNDTFNQWWATGKPPADAGAYCAQQGKGSSVAKCATDGGLNHGRFCPVSYCVSSKTGQQAQCTSGNGIPEQVNLQIASPDSVVVQFVTHEAAAPADPPTVRMGTASGTLDKTVTGVTHAHKTAGGRTYYMHFVRLTGLAPRAKYFYNAQSGAAGAETSDEFSFRAPYGDGETRVALMGDMGVYSWNAFGNLYDDGVDGDKIDLILHGGDHAYNDGDLDELRADGYLQAFEKTLAHVPWMPVVGNHEYYSGAKLGRYLDQTWEKWDPLPTGGDEAARVGGGHTTATSALGAFLSAGNHHGPATTTSESNSVPSHTSRYFSVDFGLTHLVALSLNGYNGVDTCTTKCNAAQVEWLKKDLAAVNRTKTPWTIAFSHFPIYLSEKREAWEAEPLAKQAWLNAEECEFEGHARNCTPPGWRPKNDDTLLTLGDARGDLEPVFEQYGLDIYWAGHIHFYQTFHGPLSNGKVISEGTTNPKGVIHVCSGNGGPPSASNCKSHPSCKLCVGKPYSYTRITTSNATDLLWEQVSNSDGKVIDSWTLHQDKHGSHL